MKILFDDDGLIYKTENDGSRGYGDSCCQTMRYHHLLFVRKKMGIDNPSNLPYSLDSDLLRSYLKFLDHDDLLIRAPRHLLPPEWPDPVKDFARDQHDPLLMAMGRQAPIYQSIIRRQIKAFQARHWFYQNLDAPIPQTFSILRRAQRLDSSNWLLSCFRTFSTGTEGGFDSTSYRVCITFTRIFLLLIMVKNYFGRKYSPKLKKVYNFDRSLKYWHE